MGHSQAAKAQSRERILAEAARQVRDAGLESLSVGAVMKRVGLTHGGFYGHFESRSALQAQALERALEEGEANAKSTAGARAGRRSLAGIARSYLSRAHRDKRERGCAIAALASDVGRADAASREVMAAHLDGFIQRVAETLDGDEARAMVAVSTLVGALMLSRVVSDPARSDALLRAVRDSLAESETGSSAAGSPTSKRTP